MVALKKVLVFMMGGAMVGLLLASLIAPSMLDWWNQPGSSVQAMCPCAETTRTVISAFIRSQLVGAVIGAVVGLVLGIVVARGKPSAAPLAPRPPAGP